MTTYADINAKLKDDIAKEEAGLITDSAEFLELAAGAAERLLGLGRVFPPYYFCGHLDHKEIEFYEMRLNEAMDAMEKIFKTVMAAKEESAKWAMETAASFSRFARPAHSDPSVDRDLDGINVPDGEPEQENDRDLDGINMPDGEHFSARAARKRDCGSLP